MTRYRHTLKSTWLALIVLLAPIVGAVPAAAAVAPPAGPQEFAVVQNGNCTPISAYGDGSETVSEHYDYRSPYNTEPNVYTYASHGTSDKQDNQVSNLYVYRGSGGYSLVVLHDEYAEQASEAPNGSTVTMEFSGLPEAGSWVVRDDSYPGQDDQWQTGETTAEIDWMWGAARTDGGAYLGLGELGSEPVTLTPGFNDAANQWGEWTEESEAAAEMDAWRLLSGNGSSTTLDMNEPVSIYRGGCDAISMESPSAALSTPGLDAPELASPGENVTLDASASTGDVTEYRWDFDGDGTTEETTTEATIEHAFEEGQYTVAVSVVDGDDNVDTAYADLTVSTEANDSAPEASVSGPELTDIGMQTVFDASGTTDDYAVTSYEWDFDGDDEPEVTTEKPLVEHAFEENGTYTVTVTAIDARDQSSSATTTVEVRDTVPPNAEADGPATASVNETVSYTAVDSFDSSTNLSYTWTFGDGTNATDANVTHAFDAPGTYNVTVTATDAGGNTDTATVETTVTEAAVPLNASLSAPGSAMVGTNVTLDASASTGDVAEYRFDVDGDGTPEETTENDTLTWQYTESGTYDATVQVVDDSGNESTASTTVSVTNPDAPSAALADPGQVELDYRVTLDASASTGDVTEYQWDLDGDGTPEETTENATLTTSFSEVGNYTVGVTAVDEDDDTASAQVTFEVADTVKPWPDIDGPNVVGVGQDFEVDAEDAVDNGEIASYEWSFGDNATATGEGVAHVYEEPGNYTLTLSVTDEAGNERSYSEPVTVRNESVGDIEEPEAVFDIPDTVSLGDSVELDASESFDIGGELTDTYRWDLDGDYEVDATTNATANRTLDEPGRYPVVLWVTDETGNTDMWLQVVTVTDDTEPSATFDAPDGITAGDSASFDASESSDPAGISSYSWTFGDGESATGETASHTFDSAGDYEVTLSVTDNAGNVATVTETVSVDQQDQADPSPSPSPSPSPGGAPGGNTVELSNFEVDATEVAAGDPVTATVSLENTGSSSQSKFLTLTAGDYSEQASRVLSAGETATVTFTPTFDEPGTYTLSVGSNSVQVDVFDASTEFTVTDTRVRTQDIQVGESAIIEATIENTGNVAGNYTMNLTMADGEMLEQTVTVPANGTETVAFTPTVEQAGEHTVTLGSQTLTFSVSQQQTSTPTTDGPTSTSTSTTPPSDDGSGSGVPGFGLAVALVALAAAALLAARDD